MDKDKPKSFAYQIGYIFTAIMVVCVAAAIIGVTIKFMIWLF